LFLMYEKKTRIDMYKYNDRDKHTKKREQ